MKTELVFTLLIVCIIFLVTILVFTIIDLVKMKTGEPFLTTIKWLIIGRPTELKKIPELSEDSDIVLKIVSVKIFGTNHIIEREDKYGNRFVYVRRVRT